jgi:hypothetical protein
MIIMITKRGYLRICVRNQIKPGWGEIVGASTLGTRVTNERGVFEY